MRFSLSNDSRELIRESTGLSHDQQCSTFITEMSACSQSCGDKGYVVKKSRDIAPRGSIYLQMGRIMSLNKVKSYLKRI